MTRLEISIDQDICIACGLCPEIAPRHFYIDNEDGKAHVKEDNPNDPTSPGFHGILGKVVVAHDLEDEAIEAVEHCPVDCIYVDYADAEIMAG